MGLDMYLFVEKDGVKTEIGYWRKCPDLHGYFEQLWNDRGQPMPKGKKKGEGGFSNLGGDFNCIPLRLYDKDITKVMSAIRNRKLPHTEGFFFGSSENDEEQIKNDLEIFRTAKGYLADGYKVFYDSWW
jgi:hypothetical protein